MKKIFRNITLVFLLVAVVAYLLTVYVRLAHASFGCPNWPGCFGEVLMSPKVFEPGFLEPLIRMWEQNQPSVSWLMTGFAGALLLLSFGQMRERPKVIINSALVAVLAGAVAWLPMHMNHPAALGGFLGVLLILALHRLWSSDSVLKSQGQTLPFWTWLSRVGLVLLLIDIYLGGWLSVTGGGLSCPDVPTCLGRWLPAADYGSLLRTILTPEGNDGIPLLPGGLIALNVLHRITAVVAFLLLTVLAQGVTSNPKVPDLSRQGLWLSGLLLIQVALGIGLVLLRLPVVLGVAHALVSVLLLFRVSGIERYLSGRSLGRAPSEGGGDSPEASVSIEKPMLPGVPPLAVPEPGLSSPESLYQRLKGQLGKTRSGLTGFLSQLPIGRKAIDREFLEELESQLLMADIGVSVTADIIRHLTDSLDRQELLDVGVLREQLQRYLHQLIKPVSVPLVIPETIRPFVVLVVGVNGVGKTTTIGKLAKRLQQRGLNVMLAAGDTFRAAAVEQLQTWGERNQVPVIAQHTGADSASVIYDALEAAKARGIDVLIADTAGRLHNKSNLMEELTKIKRIMARLDPAAPHEVLLVLDGGTGQNALNQAREFHEAVGLTGIALTKLDGTAKGGVLFALARQFGVPIRFIGVGEGIDDLQDFNAEQFIGALFDEPALRR